MPKLKILAVCGFGIGSSLLLKLTIERALRELNLAAEVENTDIKSTPSLPADYIFTSVELAKRLDNCCDTQVITINHYTDLVEVKTKLQKAILADLPKQAE